MMKIMKNHMILLLLPNINQSKLILPVPLHCVSHRKEYKHFLSQTDLSHPPQVFL